MEWSGVALFLLYSLCKEYFLIPLIYLNLFFCYNWILSCLIFVGYIVPSCPLGPTSLRWEPLYLTCHIYFPTSSFFFGHVEYMWILVPPPGYPTCALQWKWSPKHWPVREVPSMILFPDSIRCSQVHFIFSHPNPRISCSSKKLKVLFSEEWCLATEISRDSLNLHFSLVMSGSDLSFLHV